MKKLLFLLTIVLTLFTVVYATEDVLLISPAPDADVTVTDEAVENIDDVETEDPHAGHDYEDLAEENVAEGDIDAEHTHDHSVESTSTSGTTVVGAIIAIAIVVAVIGLVALLQKQ